MCTEPSAGDAADRQILLWLSSATALGLTMGGALAMAPLRQRAPRHPKSTPEPLHRTLGPGLVGGGV